MKWFVRGQRKAKARELEAGSHPGSVPHDAAQAPAVVDPGLLDLPWHLPLDTWPDDTIASLPKGISRHLVRFVHLSGAVVANGRVYFAPHSADAIGVFHVRKVHGASYGLTRVVCV